MTLDDALRAHDLHSGVMVMRTDEWQTVKFRSVRQCKWLPHVSGSWKILNLVCLGFQRPMCGWHLIHDACMGETLSKPNGAVGQSIRVGGSKAGTKACKCESVCYGPRSIGPFCVCSRGRPFAFALEASSTVHAKRISIKRLFNWWQTKAGRLRKTKMTVSAAYVLAPTPMGTSCACSHASTCSMSRASISGLRYVDSPPFSSSCGVVLKGVLLTANPVERCAICPPLLKLNKLLMFRLDSEWIHVCSNTLDCCQASDSVRSPRCYSAWMHASARNDLSVYASARSRTTQHFCSVRPMHIQACTYIHTA